VFEQSSYKNNQYFSDKIIGNFVLFVWMMFIFNLILLFNSEGAICFHFKTLVNRSRSISETQLFDAGMNRRLQNCFG